VRRLVADAAVLGSTFPADALIAVSGQDEQTVRAAVADLVRREVLSVSADPRSPERGSYGFAQQMLRQVAYETLSRRDRKTRHLKVAAHLRAAFPNDGEEVADVIARHYLDALHAISDDPDVGEIRGLAITALIQAAERAERTGALDRAAASYATAAELNPHGVDPADAAAAVLWERAAHAASADSDFAAAVGYAERARSEYGQRGQDRAAARAQAIAGRALRWWGRHADARDQLTAAVEVLRADPDLDTVDALKELATLEVFAGSPGADRLTAEALVLGQALDVGAGQLAGLLLMRGLYHDRQELRPQAISYFRESARIAAQIGDTFTLGRAMLNLSDVLARGDPAAGADAARTAAAYLRRAGGRVFAAVAIHNLAEALLQLGDWDGAEAELAAAADSDALADIEEFTCDRAWLAALRGDAGTAETLLTGLPRMRASEDPQWKSAISTAEAFTAAARRRPQGALRHAREILAQADAVGISHDYVRWAWPLAACCTHELGDGAAARELLALLDAYQPGYLAPMLRAERDLARVRLAARDGDPAGAASFAAAVGGLRELSTPYHLAHGLLDYAQYLTRTRDAGAAAAAIEEARGIAGRLRCQPLLDRAAGIALAKPPVQHQIAALPELE